MLLLFFSRRILRLGVLRSVPVRVLAVTGISALAVVCSVAAYHFLEPRAAEAATWRLLFDTATVSVVLWVQIAFLFVKILFANADGLLELSFQLPLTNRERASAFLIYEAVMTAVVVGAGSFSLSISALLLLGPAVLPLLLESILFPVVLTYLALHVLHLALARLFARLGLRAVSNVLLVLAMFAPLVVYSVRLPALITDVSGAYLDGRDQYVWVTSVAWVSRHHGSAVASAATALLALVLVLLSLWLTPDQHVRHSRYVDVPVLGRARRLLTPYDWCFVRSSQTTLCAAVSLASFVYLCVASSLHPVWSLSILSLSGVYQFAATRPLRVLVGADHSPWRIYWQLLRAQLIVLTVLAVPALVVLLAIQPQVFALSALPLAGCIGGALLAICVGVVFPAEKDNPFSVFIGLA
ncbi:hypothetical protein [Quadrisphaera sp. DSM 44207]|uniref:hypothetical protein n=1 Tax=Quadrisphaera sp. DSM 44207 TaxID=1881057 RepID=UPI00115F96BC|nr:hypothetical protein [Quadrisphaera sp. DSM 44207]